MSEAREGKLPSDRKSFKVALEKIITEGRARTDFSHVPQLIKSIREKGMAHPVVVVDEVSKPGFFRLVAGECRYRVHLILSLEDDKYTYIECTYRDDLDELSQKELELEENVVRKDFEWPERIEALRQIDELKRKKHALLKAENKLGPNDPTEWSAERTAEEIGAEPTVLRKSVKFAEKLKNRPDLALKVQALPLSQAMREFERRVEAEHLDRKTASGELKLSTNLKFGSCLDLIKEVKSESVDLILTDPPFGNEEIEKQEGKDRGVVQSYTQMLKPADNLNMTDVKTLLTALIPELFRVLKPASHLYLFFSSEAQSWLVEALTKSGFDVQPWPVIWEKTNSTAPFRGYNFMPCYEPILFAHKPDGEKRRRLNESCKAVLKYQTLASQSKTHPFQKPQALLEYLIKLSTHSGQVVLDPFAGSGATIKAALAAGRSALGFEVDETRFKDAQGLLTKG